MTASSLAELSLAQGTIPRRTRPWLRTSLILLISTAYLLPLTQVLYSLGDDGTLLYGAQRVSEGAIPGKDFVEVIGPGAFYWLGLFFRIFGVGWQVSRIQLLSTSVATVYLLYDIARQVCSEGAALILWLFVLVVGVPVWPAISHHWDSNLFATLSLWFYLRCEATEDSRWGLIAGIFAGVATLFIPPKGVYVLAALLASAALRRVQSARQSWKSLWVLASGFAAVIAALLAAYEHMGAMRDLFYANVVFPMTGYSSVNRVPYGYGLFAYSVGPSVRMFGAQSPVAGLLCAGLSMIPFLLVAILPLLAAVALFSDLWSGRKRVRWTPVVAVALCGYALWVSEAHRIDIVHFVFGAPFLLITLVACSSRGFRGPTGRLIAGIVVAGLIPFGIVNAMDRLHGVRAIATRRGTVMSAQNDQALRFLQSSVRAGEDVLVYPYTPVYYYLENLHNPTRYSILLYGYNTPEQFDEVIEDLQKRHVRYVLAGGPSDHVLRDGFPGYHQPPFRERKLEIYLGRYYEPRGVKGTFRIVERKSDSGRASDSSIVASTGGENGRTKE